VVLCVGNEVIGYGTLFGVVVPPEKQLFWLCRINMLIIL
jgi:hypothetical protein